jgi:hypothetical protein
MGISMNTNKQQTSLGMEASTFGWDFVFAIRYEDVNSAITKAGLPPTSFTETQPNGSETITINGDLGVWSLMQGGQGNTVRMRLPITMMTYTATPSTPIVVTNAYAEIEVELEYIPQPTTTKNGVKPHDLKFTTHPKGQDNPVDFVSVLTSGQLNGIQEADAAVLLQTWLNKPENLQEFNHVFTTVNLGEKADHADFQWLKPTHVSYAVNDMGSLATSVFAVLCMADPESKRAVPLSHQVTPNIIPTGKRSGFLISYERYLSKMVLPGVKHQFSGPVKDIPGYKWPDDYFQLSFGQTVLRNKVPLKIDNFEYEKGSTSCARIPAKGVEISMLEDRMEIEYIGLAHQITNWVGFSYNVNHIIHSNFIPDFKNNKFDLKFGDLSTFSHTATVVPTESTEIIEDVLAAIAIAITVIGGIEWVASKWVTSVDDAIGNAAQELVTNAATNEEVSSAATKFAALQATQAGNVYRLSNLLGTQLFTSKVGAAIGLFDVTWIFVSGAFADGTAQKSLPDFKVFARNLVSPLTWPGAESEYTVESVTFNGSFHVVGNSGFSSNK